MEWMPTWMRPAVSTHEREEEGTQGSEKDVSFGAGLLLATARTTKTILVRSPFLALAFFLIVRIGSITNYPH